MFILKFKIEKTIDLFFDFCLAFFFIFLLKKIKLIPYLFSSQHLVHVTLKE